MFEVRVLDYEGLNDVEKEAVPNNGSGKKFAAYLKVLYNDEVLCLKSDAMEPEDACFHRDLSWIPIALKQCYELGRYEEKEIYNG